MQGKKVGEYLLFSIPLEMLEESGISEESVIQMSASEGKIVIEAADDDTGYLCDGECEDCPVGETECDGDCENCPCNDRCEESEVF